MNENLDNLPVPTNGQAPEKRSGGGSGAAAPVSALAERPINILIVDDEPRNLTVLETVLDDPSYRLVRAESADQALHALVVEEFALLILDIRMPGMTGFELAQIIKERKKTARVPIIFLTAYYNENQHVLEGYGTGAVDYLQKPVNPTMLRSKVAVFADLHRKSREYEMANRALLTEVTERRRAQDQLRELNETLDQRVAERTEALVMTSAALNETAERYRSLFDGSLDAITSLGPEGRFEAANPALLRLTGRTLEELKNLHFLDLCAPEHREAAQNVFRAAFCQECITLDTTIITATGERRDLFISGAPAIAGGKFVGVSCIARDITERKRAESELNAALATAEKANLAKSEFLSSMSHELRSPLNAILGFAQLMESASPAPTTSQAVCIAQILHAGWHLLHLINEILDLAAIESGKVSLSSEPVSLSDVLLECQAMMAPQAQQRGIRMNFPQFDKPIFVRADRTRLKQIFINLISNAIKYNKEEGTVLVDCTVGALERIRISVKDTGAGLPPDKLAQLFQPFNRLGQEAGGIVGTGIGLVVTKRLAELMEGVLGVESEVGVGSVFWCELHSAPEPQLSGPSGDDEPAIPLPLPIGAPRRTLLYVEDNPANMQLVEQLIARRSDLRLLGAVNGTLGIELARSAQPNVIFMDINLPDISGIEALKILREDPTTAHIPIVALSANAMPRDIEKGMEAGFFRYLTKPIRVNEFMNTLNGALEFAEKRMAPGK